MDRLPTTVIIVLGLLSVIMPTWIANVITQTSQTSSYEIIDTDGSKFYCDYCPAGTYWKANCIHPSSMSQCTPCPNGTFQNTSNKAESCALCHVACPFGRQEVVSNCTPKANLKCQCGDGYYWSAPAGLCLTYNVCGAGLGVKEQGTPFHNTVCQSCQPGHTFSPNASLTQICQPCSECPEDLFEKMPCTRNNDTVCSKGPDDNGLSAGAIAGIVAGVVFVILLIVIVLCYRYGILTFLQDIICGKCEPPDDCKEAYVVVNQGNHGNRPHQNGDSHRYDQVDHDNVTLTQKCMPDKDIPMKQNPDSRPTSLETTDDNPQYDSMSPQDGRVSKDILRELSQDVISFEWQFFIRCLFPTDKQPDEATIQAAIINNRDNVREQIYQLLLLWWDKPYATLDNIIRALDEHNRPDLVLKYQKFKKSTTV